MRQNLQVFEVNKISQGTQLVTIIKHLLINKILQKECHRFLKKIFIYIELANMLRFNEKFIFYTGIREYS